MSLQRLSLAGKTPVLASGGGPEWVSPTLFFGGTKLTRQESVARAGEVGRRARHGRGGGFELVDVEMKRATGRLAGAALRGQARRHRPGRAPVGLRGGLGHPRRRGPDRGVATPSRSPRPASTGRSRRRPTTGASSGKLAKLSSYEPVDGRRHWTGRLASFEDGVVTLDLEKEGGSRRSVPLDKISHGRLEVEFPRHG